MALTVEHDFFVKISCHRAPQEVSPELFFYSSCRLFIRSLVAHVIPGIIHLLRFGPGRLSRRHHQTERLRELRTRLSSGFTHGADITPLPLSKDPVVVCDDALASSNKRRRGPSGAARQLLRQRFSENASVPLALVQKSTLLAGPTGARASEQPLISGEDAGAHDDFGDGGRNESGVNARTCGSRGRGFANHDGADGVLYLNTDRRTCKSSTTSEVANFDRGGTRCILAPGSKSSIGPLVILPVRSAPASRRPRAAKSAVGMPRSMLDTQGDKKTAKQCARSRGTQRAKTAQQYTHSSKQPRGDGDASENDDVGIAGFSGGEHDTDGEYYGTLPGSECAPLAPPGSSINTPGLGYPGIVGACGGIVLRLTPAERSLEPWSSVVSPLRAMCDIEPSLSRAGLECREVINAVEAAQEMKSQDRAKVRKTKQGTYNDPRFLALDFINESLRCLISTRARHQWYSTRRHQRRPPVHSARQNTYLALPARHLTHVTHTADVADGRKGPCVNSCCSGHGLDVNNF